MALPPSRYDPDKQGLSVADRTNNALLNYAATDARPVNNKPGNLDMYKRALGRAQQSNRRTVRPHEGAL